MKRSPLLLWSGRVIGAWLLLKAYFLAFIFIDIFFALYRGSLVNPRIFLSGAGFSGIFDSGEALLSLFSVLALVFSVVFWFHRQSWLSAGLLVIAGALCGSLREYFFYYPLRLLAWSACVLLAAWLIHFLPFLGKPWDADIFKRSFWNWRIILTGSVCLGGALMIWLWLMLPFFYPPAELPPQEDRRDGMDSIALAQTVRNC